DSRRHHHQRRAVALSVRLVRPDDPVLGSGPGPRLGATRPDAGRCRGDLLHHRSSAARPAQGAAPGPDRQLHARPRLHRPVHPGQPADAHQRGGSDRL
ncbi:MAG: Cell division integral membrane protein, YggT and half-length relatives, partial [uncultured Propionibacteriaceae bacterium]